MAKQNQDNPEELRRMMIRESFRPFAGRSASDKMTALNSLPSQHPKRVLDACFEEVFMKIDNTNKYKDFYDSDYESQVSMIDEILEVEIAKIEDSKQPLLIPEINPSEDEEDEGEQG